MAAANTARTLQGSSAQQRMQVLELSPASTAAIKGLLQVRWSCAGDRRGSDQPPPQSLFVHAAQAHRLQQHL